MRLLLLLTLIPFYSYSVTFSGNGYYYKKEINNILDNVIIPMLYDLPTDQKHRLDNVDVELYRAFSGIDFTAVAIYDGKRKVKISDTFVLGLSYYVESFLVEKYTSINHFREWYFNYYAWRVSPVFDGPSPKNAMEWARYTPEDANTFEAFYKKLFSAALMDVILHELGHHATNSLYTSRTSNSTKRKLEANADKWATDIGLRNYNDSNVLGRLIALGYIFEIERFLKLSDIDSSHPLPTERLQQPLDLLCNDDSSSKEIQSACNLLKQESESFSKSEYSMEAYRVRVQRGEGYANYALGEILLRQGAYNQACEKFQTAYQKSMVMRAAIHIGWCYQYGHIKPTSGDPKKLALIYYGFAADAGFIDAQKRYTYLKNNP